MDGVFLVDLQLRDERVAALQELRMPAIVFGTPKGSGMLPAVWQDDVGATATVVEYLAGLGHRRLARVNGIPRYWHTRLRADAFHEVARACGLESVSVEGDYTGEHAARQHRAAVPARHPVSPAPSGLSRQRCQRPGQGQVRVCLRGLSPRFRRAVW